MSVELIGKTADGTTGIFHLRVDGNLVSLAFRLKDITDGFKKKPPIEIINNKLVINNIDLGYFSWHVNSQGHLDLMTGKVYWAPDDPSWGG